MFAATSTVADVKEKSENDCINASLRKKSSVVE